MSENTERTLLMVKPDGVHRGFIGEIIKRLEQKGFKLLAMKFLQPTEELVRKHYADLSTRPFYSRLVKYMALGPVVAMVWEGLNMVKLGRQFLGESIPADSMSGTIRGDLCVTPQMTVLHGSDSVESANKEIALWFSEEELVSWQSDVTCWVYNED